MMTEISKEKNNWFTIVETRGIWIIYLLIVHYIHLILPSTENTKAVANKLQTGQAGTFETLNLRKSELIGKG